MNWCIHSSSALSKDTSFLVNHDHFLLRICVSDSFYTSNPQAFKMHFFNTIAFASTLFASFSYAAPQYGATWKPTVTVQLANDQSGANADVVIPLDGVRRPVQELWGNTAVASNGLVFASSAQLTDFDQTAVCTFTEKPRLHATLDAEKTWLSFGKSAVDLCSAFIVCKCKGM